MTSPNRPLVFPFIDLSLSNVDLAYDTSPLQQTGFQSNQVIPSLTHNTLWLLDSLWLSYFDYGVPALADTIDLTADKRWSTDKLSYAPGDSVIIAPGASPATMPTYFFDGLRIVVDDDVLKPGRASPLFIPEATKPGRLWIYLRTADISFPSQPRASIRVESVAAGTPENPGAQELALRGVDIDAAGVITANVDPASEPTEEVQYGTRPQRWKGLTSFDALATFTVTGGTAVSVKGTLSAAGGAVTAVDANNDDAANPTVTIANASGTGATIDGANAGGAAAEVENTAAGGTSLRAVKLNAGTAVVGDTTAGGDTAVAGLGGSVGVFGSSATGTGVEGSSATGLAVRGEVTGAGVAVFGQGGPSPASRAGSFLSVDTGAITLLGTSAGGSLSSAVAVQGTGNGAATGVKGFSSDGYGVEARSDPTSPTRSALRLEPQDDDPTTPQQGDVLFNSSRGPQGRPRVYGTQWESVHASPKGRVWNVGLPASGGPIAGGTGNISLVQVQPEEVGDLSIEVSGSLEFTGDTDYARVDIVDVTSALIVASAFVRTPDTDGAGNRYVTYCFKGRRTVPNTALRTFATEITAFIGSFNYDNSTTEVQGTL